MALRIGRATRDPVLRYHTNGSEGLAFANFAIATERNYKDKSGKKITDFLEVTVRGPLAEHCANYIKKGKMIGLCGPIYDKEYEKDGNIIRSKYMDVIQVQFMEYDNANSINSEPEKNKKSSSNSFLDANESNDYDLSLYSDFDTSDFI